MRNKLSWLLLRITRAFWFRVSLYGIGAICAALVARWTTPFFPDGFADLIRSGTSRDMLTIIASSMLVVATFALGTMVQAFAAAANLATPRAARVLIDDTRSQNVLATFLGAFVFSIVGLFAESFGYYSKTGEAVMLTASGAVIALVIVTLFSWLDHLANLVRLGETMRKVEARAENAFRDRAKSPRLGGGDPTGAPPTNWSICTEHTGYLVHIEISALQALAERAGGTIRVIRLPGELADPSRPLAQASWQPDERQEAKIRAAFTLAPERSFDEDPRFCLSVLAEIGSRALSPGINDPGTAIGIITTQQRLLTLWARGLEHNDDEPPCPRVLVDELATRDIFDDAFGPLLRDGADMIEVGLRLQKSLLALSRLGRPDYAENASRLSEKALRHSKLALDLEEDHDLLRDISADISPPPDGSAPRDL